jgi:hypothetical protein
MEPLSPIPIPVQIITIAAMTTTCTNTEIAQMKPRLKKGTLVLPLGQATFVGRGDFGIEVNLPAAHLILAAMNGSTNCQEICQEFGVPMEQLTSVVLDLDDAHLLDTQETKITVHTRFHSPNPHRSSHTGDDSNDGAYQQLQYRISPELSFTTWLHDVKDGGVQLISARRNCEVLIYGDSRIAILLYGILLSSGISHAGLVTKREVAAIADQDLCAGYLRASDVGLSLKTRTDELRRELSLFPATSSPLANEDQVLRQVRVAIGRPPADQLQQWMSDGTPHLLVENPDCASINIGPLVLPGATPCLRCVSLAKQDQNIIWREIQRQQLSALANEAPVAVAHHVAGLIGLELLRFIDSGQSQLIGQSLRVDYHSPGTTQPHMFTRHPACGCNW